MSSSFSISSCLAGLVLLSSCSQTPVPLANPRIVVQLVENQSEDPELRYAGAMVSFALAQTLNGNPEVASTVVRDAEGVRESGAGLLVRGALRRRPNGELVLQSEVANAYTGSLIATPEFTARDTAGLLPVVQQLAEGVTRGKVKPASGTANSWLAFGRLQLAPDEEAYVQLLKAEPDFAPAVVGYSQWLAARGRRQEVRKLAEDRGPKLPPAAQAEIALLLAETAEEQMKAWQGIALLRHTDPRPYVQAGRAAANLKDWATAQAMYEKLAELEPAHAEWWNLLGYARANQGKVDQAVEALEKYRKLAPTDPNALDSLGEVQFMNRRFDGAARAFQECALRYPQFQGGAELRKTAFALAFAGKLKEAEPLFEQWLGTTLRAAPPSLATFQRAMWLAQTKRIPEAMKLMAEEVAGSTGDRKMMAEINLALMQLGLEGKKPSTAFLQEKAKAVQDPAIRNELLLLILFSQPATPEQLKQRILAAVPGPQMVALRDRLLDLAAGGGPERSKALEKTSLVPLPENLDSGVTALELRTRSSVIR